MHLRSQSRILRLPTEVRNVIYGQLTVAAFLESVAGLSENRRAFYFRLFFKQRFRVETSLPLIYNPQIQEELFPLFETRNVRYSLLSVLVAAGDWPLNGWDDEDSVELERQKILIYCLAILPSTEQLETAFVDMIRHYSLRKLVNVLSTLKTFIDIEKVLAANEALRLRLENPRHQAEYEAMLRIMGPDVRFLSVNIPQIMED